MTGAMEPGASPGALPAERSPAERSVTPGVVAVQLGAFAVAAVIVALTAGLYHWDPWAMAVIAAFTILSELTSIITGPNATSTMRAR